MCTCRDRPNVSALRSSVQPAPRDTLGLAVPRPRDEQAKQPDQHDKHLSVRAATRRADVTRVRYAEARTIPATDANALAILRGELIPYDPDKIIEHAFPSRTDVLTALLLVALTGFCGGRFPMEAI